MTFYFLLTTSVVTFFHDSFEISVRYKRNNTCVPFFSVINDTQKCMCLFRSLKLSEI